MTQKQMLEAIKKRLKILSHSQLSSELGYRSQNTISYWLKKDRIPITARACVEDYFQQLKKNGE